MVKSGKMKTFEELKKITEKEEDKNLSNEYKNEYNKYLHDKYVHEVMFHCFGAFLMGAFFSFPGGLLGLCCGVELGHPIIGAGIGVGAGFLSGSFVGRLLSRDSGFDFN